MKIAIVDFDDTIFPTTEYKENPLLYLYSEAIDNNAYNIIKALEKIVDRVIIITNARISWLNFCRKHFLPKTNEILNDIDIYSTVDSGFSEGDSFYWKRNFILSIFGSGHPPIEEVISIGDAPGDKVGAYSLSEIFPDIVIKHVKFQETPNIWDFLVSGIVFLFILKNIRDCKYSLDLEFKKISNITNENYNN